MKKIINILQNSIRDVLKQQLTIPFIHKEVTYTSLLYWLILGALVIWHTYQALFFATTITLYVPPDELYHYKFIQLYNNFLSPFLHQQTSLFHLGSIERDAYLYHYLMNKAQVLNVTSLPDYLFLRRLNVLISLGSVLMFIVFLRQVTKKRLVHVLALLALTNTVMFQFISGSINYDNFVNFLSILLLTILAFFITSNRWLVQKILLMCVVICLGILTKISYLPFLAMTTVIIIVDIIIRKERYNSVSIRKHLTNKVTISCLMLLLLLSVLVGERYGLNLLRYQSLIPSCDELLTQEQCEQNAVYRRNYHLSTSFDDVTFNDRLDMRISYAEYLPKWSFIMQARTHGVLAHKILSKNSWQLAMYGLISIVSIIALIRKLKLGWNQDTIFVTMFLIYLFILSFQVNYLRYWFHGIPDIAVQGRYLFPLIFIFYYLIMKYLLDIGKHWVYRTVVTLVIIGVFFTGSLFWFTNIAEPGHLSTTDRGRWYDLNLQGSLRLYDFFYDVHIEPQIK
ncbi:MAG: hypothetical protein ACOCXQ_01155 [Patescibacteria group bacterium]